MDRIRTLAVLVALVAGCTPAALPRVQLSVARGERIGAASERRESVVWLRLSWGRR